VLEKDLQIEKSLSEKLLWKHVHVNLNFLKNVKQTSKPLEDVQEDITDAPEDAWEEHVKFVQELNVQLQNLLINCASENTTKDAEEFIAEDTEEFTEEFIDIINVKKKELKELKELKEDTNVKKQEK